MPFCKERSLSNNVEATGLMFQLKMSGLSSTRLLSVPKSGRQEILNLAHETSLAGHMRVTITCQKILNYFYLSSLKKDVVGFCKSCHACQMVGKPNQTTSKPPLLPIPAVEEPHRRIIVDCVGPLSKTRFGNQYLLTICVLQPGS